MLFECNLSVVQSIEYGKITSIAELHDLTEGNAVVCSASKFIQWNTEVSLTIAGMFGK